MIQKLEAIGIDVNKNKWEKWDDGSNQDDVAKIYVRGGPKGIRYIYFDYVKSGQVKEGPGHGFLDGCGFTDMFEIDHLKNEHLESVEGYYIEGDGIQAVQFKTNFKTSQLMGYYDHHSSKFSLAVKEKKIIGFHGSGNIFLKSLGAYFNLISATRVKADGGKGGREWDDGSDHDNVSKIHVGGFQGLQFISFEYVKNGQGITGSIHGVSPRGVIKQTFVINHLNNEYLVSVEGYYDDVTGVIHGLQFTTNLRALDFVGNDKGMKKFSLGANGNRIIGFHGYAENSLNSLGVYFTTHTSNKLDLHGNPTGCFWDDGSSNDGIRKVLVYSADYLRCIRFEFNNGGKVEKTHRRRDLHNEAEFVLDYPNEFITSVEGTIWNISGKAKHISTLIFKTSKGRTSPTFGRPPNHTKFLLEKKGNALVGFYGYYDHGTLNAIGAYYRPMPPPTNIIKLEAKGGEGGASWDDGGFNGVKRIFIGVSENTVAFIKFMYLKNAKMVFGNDHGNNLCGVQEFELNYPSEYLTSVEANYDEKSGVITMLKFVTNIKPSPNIGLNTTTSILHVHEKKNHKIVGFHGKSSNMLHQLGVHVVPL